MGLTPAMQLNVGWLDWEFTGEDNRERLERLLGSEMLDLPYLRCEQPLVAELARIQTFIRDFRLDFVVEDSLGAATDGPPEGAEQANAVARANRQLEVPVLAIAHVNRSGDESRPFGSQFWHNQARATWYVKQASESTGDVLSVAMFNKKANTRKTAPPIAFTLTFDDEAYTTQIAIGNIHETQDFAVRLRASDRIREALRTGPKTYIELASELEETVDTVSKTVRRGEKSGIYVRLPGPGGVYQVALATRPSDPQ